MINNCVNFHMFWVGPGRLKDFDLSSPYNLSISIIGKHKSKSGKRNSGMMNLMH